jgi:hypothetical protein
VTASSSRTAVDARDRFVFPHSHQLLSTVLGAHRPGWLKRLRLEMGRPVRWQRELLLHGGWDRLRELWVDFDTEDAALVCPSLTLTVRGSCATLERLRAMPHFGVPAVSAAAASALCAALARCPLLTVLSISSGLLQPDADAAAPQPFLHAKAVIRELSLANTHVAGPDGGVALAATRHSAAVGGLRSLVLMMYEFGGERAAVAAARTLGAAITAAGRQLEALHLWGPTDLPIGSLPGLRHLSCQEGSVDTGLRVLLQSPQIELLLQLDGGCWAPSAALRAGYPRVVAHPAAGSCLRWLALRSEPQLALFGRLRTGPALILLDVHESFFPVLQSLGSSHMAALKRLGVHVHTLRVHAAVRGPAAAAALNSALLLLLVLLPAVASVLVEATVPPGAGGGDGGWQAGVAEAVTTQRPGVDLRVEVAVAPEEDDLEPPEADDSEDEEDEE